MNTIRKRLPVGIETFSKIIEGGHYYVDKTGFALQLIEEGDYFFLSRPRRFGKSLFVDTLKSLFEGRKALFAGLYAEDKWDWTRRFPVVSISFSGGVFHTAAELNERIHEILIDNQERLGVTCTHTSISGQFLQLLRLAREKHGEKVVVLIDEYDKPILDNIGDSQVALAMREGLKNLYSAVKQADADLRFVLMTGVSKFSKVNLFSGLNNLDDITLMPRYSALCGYTDADLDNVFAPELDGLPREQIRHWYNGYNWRGEAVYNPYDLLLLLRKREFRPWWFESGTPSFLIRLLAERQAWLPTLDQAETDAQLLGSVDIDQIPGTTLMFQAGYLTIDREEIVSGSHYYTLRIPNHEVRQSLYANLLSHWTGDSGHEVSHKRQLSQDLAAARIDRLPGLFQAFFASIPYQWYANNPIAQYEGYYASVFYAYFVASGLEVRVEDATNHGRIDMAVILPNQIYLFEFKVVESGPNGRAMQQLLNKGYAEKYRAHGVPIQLIGVEFSREARNVVGFESQETGA